MYLRFFLSRLSSPSQDPRDRVSDEVTVSADMLDFLQEFFEGG